MLRHLWLLLGVVGLGIGAAACSAESTPPPSTSLPPIQVANPTPAPLTTAAPLILDQLALPPVDAWWNDAVFYEVFVRSFYDSDGDGIGDLNGLIEKLDYLNDGDPASSDDLGVTGLWLMPIMESPSYHGYDIADYLSVERDYGSNADFKRLIDAAHQRGIKIIIDLVLNHTSAEHPWFQQARNADSPFRDWFVWSERDLGGAWYAAPDGYYYAYFWDQMPDLNYRYEPVTRAAYSVADFWLDEMGADGFRLDAVKHLIEDGGIIQNTPETHAWLHDFQAHLTARHPDVLTVGEIFGGSASLLSEYISNAEINLAFEFNFAQAIIDTLRVGKDGSVRLAQTQLRTGYPPGQYATFITNHDQNRVASQLLGNLEKAKVAGTLLLTSPGTPFIYYGEEIGMLGIKPDELIRTPMQWSGAPASGFTAGEPWEALNEDWPEKNVATQAADPGSLFNHYRRLIQLRDAQAVLRRGDLLPLKTDNLAVYAYLRIHPEGAALVVVNLSNREVADYALRVDASPLRGAWQAEDWLGSVPAPTAPTFDAAGGLADYRPIPTLTPFGSYVIGLMPAP